MNPVGTMISSGRVLLDTSIIVDHFRGDVSIGDSLQRSKTRFVPTVVLGELQYGALRSQRFEHHQEQLMAFLRAVTILPIDEKTAFQYARLRCELAKAGKPIPENDIWIASVALQHEIPLVTRDQHFQHVPSLELLHW